MKRDKRTSRSILTTEGEETYSRYRLFAVNDEKHPDSVETCKKIYGSTSVYPIDIYLGIDKLPFKATADAALRIAKIGATSSSYKEASQRFKDDFELPISENQIREIVDYVGEIILLDDIQRTEKAVSAFVPGNIRSAKRGRRPANGFVLYCEVDGAMFNTRSAKKDDCQTKNEKEDSSWRENKLGLVFRSDKLESTGKFDDEGKPVYRIGDREYICTTQGIDTFRERLLYLLLKNGLEDASDIVLISDGAAWIRKTREKYFPSATQILDLFHLKENVMKFAQYIYHNKESEYYPWWKEVCHQLENGKWKTVLQRSEIAVYCNEKETPKGIVNLYRYIWNNRDIIDYPRYKEKGYFIGSGGIESGNKTVLQERLKLSGMKWYVDSAESLLSLRAKLKSNLWESYVVPLVRNEYPAWHSNDNSVRHKQRQKHRNLSKNN